MAKIVMLSDYLGLTTGYGRMGKEISRALHHAGHEIIYIGWGYRGEEHHFPFQVIPCDTIPEEYGRYIVPEIIRKERPDILLSLGDPWMTEFLAYTEEMKYVYHVAYFPIDGYPIPSEWIPWIKKADYPVVFSKFAQQLVHEVTGQSPRLIYHGVDLGAFSPMENREELREKLGLSGKFVVGTVARNQPRKNLPALVKAFSEFSNKKEDTVLYMHTQSKDAGWDMESLVKRFNVSDRAFTTAQLNSIRGLPDGELCKVYNVFNIFVLPTMAEGFGLPIIESQACGTPVLVTDFSACSELVPDRSSLLKVKDTLIMGRNIEQAIVDTDDIKRKLDHLYHDWKRREGKTLAAMSKKSLDFAQSFSIQAMNEGFVRLIHEIESRRESRSQREIAPGFYRV